ncbi:PepSY-associated TM helix domain-containing protein [Faunimonas sp. B44]|uniref:PepSY-associated TM helix domain-containing protein n=1 Tax=Faunimonas sp. B44 TaxID=3461493 RepID=UPI004043F31C
MKTVRRVLGFVHLWTGLLLSIPLVLIGLTGSLLVFEHEIDAVLNPLPRATVGPARDPAAILDAARAAAGAGLIPTMLTMPEEEGDFASVRFARADAPGFRGGEVVLVDPVTLSAEPVAQAGRGVLRPVFMLHANLMVSGQTGRQIVGWFGVAMLVLALTGLVMWWPRGGRWKAAFLVKPKAGALRLNRDLHGAVAIWSLAVFLAVTLSGIYLSFPQQSAAAIRSVLPARDFRGSAGEVKVEPLAEAERIGIEAAMGLAEAAVPSATPGAVRLPVRPQDPYRVLLRRGTHGHGVPGITVFVDPWRAAVMEIRDPRNYTAGEFIMAWQHALHGGAGLGWAWKLAVFLSGLLPLLFVVTGFSMWLIKRGNRRRASIPRPVPVPGE